jgi:hypothetical protein
VAKNKDETKQWALVRAKHFRDLMSGERSRFVVTVMANLSLLNNFNLVNYSSINDMS